MQVYLDFAVHTGRKQKVSRLGEETNRSDPLRVPSVGVDTLLGQVTLMICVVGHIGRGVHKGTTLVVFIVIAVEDRLFLHDLRVTNRQHRAGKELQDRPWCPARVQTVFFCVFRCTRLAQPSSRQAHSPPSAAGIAIRQAP
jgi:hypothetical protein